MLLNGYFKSSAAAILVRHPGRLPPPSVVIRHAKRPWAQARRPLAGPSAHLTHRRRCPEPTPEARKTSITSPSAIFSSLASHYPAPDGHLSPLSMRASKP